MTFPTSVSAATADDQDLTDLMRLVSEIGKLGDNPTNGALLGILAAYRQQVRSNLMTSILGKDAEDILNRENMFTFLEQNWSYAHGVIFFDIPENYVTPITTFESACQLLIFKANQDAKDPDNAVYCGS